MGCPVNGYRVLVWLWTPKIDWDTTKCRLRVCSRNPQIFDVYFSVHQCPDFDWFRQFLTVRDIVSQFSWTSHVIEIRIMSTRRGNRQELTSVEFFEKGYTHGYMNHLMVMYGEIQGLFTRFLTKIHKFRYRPVVKVGSGQSRDFLTMSLKKSSKNLDITMKWFEKK